MPKTWPWKLRQDFWKFIYVSWKLVNLSYSEAKRKRNTEIFCFHLSILCVYWLYSHNTKAQVCNKFHYVQRANVLWVNTMTKTWRKKQLEVKMPGAPFLLHPSVEIAGRELKICSYNWTGGAPKIWGAIFKVGNISIRLFKI